MVQKKEINVEIGRRVRESREKRHLTQERFAELLDVSPQYISDMERGKTGVSVTTLRHICTTLAVSSDYILLGIRDTSPYSDIINLLTTLDKQYLPMLQDIIRSYAEAVTIANRNT